MYDVTRTTTALSKYLEGLDFPAQKSDIIEHLKENCAADSLIEMADNIPEKAYENASDVIREIRGRH